MKTTEARRAAPGPGGDSLTTAMITQDGRSWYEDY